MASRPGLTLRALAVVERIGNRLPDPLTLFAVMAGLVVLGSWLGACLGISVSHPGTGEDVEVTNLASATGLRRMLTEAVRNFTSFPPLGLVLVTMIGIGVAERSGLFHAALRRLVAAVPPAALTATLVFAGICGSIAADAGLIVLPPLGALLFASQGRHPLAGLAAAFAGVSGGFSANLLLTSLDPLLAGLTQASARMVAPDYEVEATANYAFMAASVLLVTTIGTLVSEKIVEPRLGRWQPAAPPDAVPPSGRTERRGLVVAGLALATVFGLAALLAVPSNGVLRDPETGSLKPFYDSIVPLLMLAFLAAGLAFGLVTGSVRSDRDVARMTGDSMTTMGTYIVLAFVAAQFVAWFGWSNLGLVLAVKGSELLRAIGLRGVPLLVGFILVTAAINFFIASASAKWAIMAPVFVPMLMLMGFSPETVQGAFRVGDSSTNIVTPLMPYFPILIAYARKHDPDVGLGTLLSAMVPYSLAFLVSWTVFLVVWISLGWSLGPGAPLYFSP